MNDLLDYMDISIHTTTQVVTPKMLMVIPKQDYFNPHHHAGGDDTVLPGYRHPVNFNPHHHAGGDVA